MFDTVTIAYRGATYEIGRGRDYYGIWAAGTSRSTPLELWPDTPEGWSAAWARFVAMETPDTIGPADRNASAPGARMTTASQGFAIPADPGQHAVWFTYDGGRTWAPSPVSG